MNRAEHLQRCKDRALEYLNSGDTTSAVGSMISDLGKHEGTESSLDVARTLGTFELLNGTPSSVRRFIEGFN